MVPLAPAALSMQENTGKNTDANFIIRDGRESDLDAITAIDADISGLPKPDYWREILDKYQRDTQRESFLVVEHEGRVAGFIIGEIRAWEFGSAPCGWIFAIGVKKDQVLVGIGSQMLATLCNRFRDAGVTKVRTMISRGHHDVLAFFRSQGMMAGPYQQLEKDLD